MTDRPVTRELAEFIVGLQYEDLPEAAVKAAKEAVLDQFGIMLRGSTLPWTRPSYDLVMDTGSRPQSTIVGQGDKVAAIEATVVNATYGHSCEMDDSGFRGSTHPGSITVPTALALAEWKHLPGKDFLLGVVAGYEALYKVGRVVSTPALMAGWHHHSVVGPFGSAAIGIRLLGLPADTAVHALAIAGSHSAGTMEYDRSGGEVKRFHAAMAARGGLVAALLAERGLTGPATILEGARGIPRMFAQVEDSSEIVEDVDDKSWFAVQARTQKCFPTVSTIHCPLQAFSMIVAEHGLTAQDIERIDVWVHPLTVGHGAAITEPDDTVSAQFSMAFSFGLYMLTGRNVLDDYMDPRMWVDERIRAVGRKLFVHADPAYHNHPDKDAYFPGRTRVTTTDGREFEIEQLYRKGGASNPITREEHYAKFRSLSSAAIGEDRMDEIIAAVEGLDEVDDVATMVPLLTK